MRTSIVLLAVLGLSLAGCHHDTSLGGPSGSTGSTGATSATTAGVTGSSGSGSSATTGTGSSGSGSGTAGNSSGSGGTTATSLDAGRAEYCAGHGAPIDVGDSSLDAGRSSTCLGNLAQRTFRFGLCTCDALEVAHPLDTDSFVLVDGGLLADGGASFVTVSGRNNGAVGSDQGVGEAPGANGVHLRVGGSLWVSDGGFTSTQSGFVNGELHAGSPVDAVTSVGSDAYCASTITGAVSIAGNLFIASSSSLGSGVTVSGQTTQQPVTVADPCDCTNLVDIAGIVAAHAGNNDDATIPDAGLDPASWAGGSGPGDFTFPCGRYYLASGDGGAAVLINSGTTWHIAGRTALMIDGDVNINAGFTLDVPEGSELDLFIAGNLAINQPTTLGSAASAANTRFYVGGSGAIALDSPSGFYGNIYAPLAEVDFNSPGDIYGAVFAKAFFNARPARLHYDEGILAAGAECATPVDAGPSPGDGGTVVDAGPVGCLSCGDCNNQACVLPGDGGAGSCGACTTSADCCAPLTCQAGVCGVVFQ